MTRTVRAVLLVIFIGHLNFSSGYQWVTVQEGKKLPNNTVCLNEKKCVGRLTLSNLILPAEVLNSSCATAFNPNSKTKIFKDQFEVLTSVERCQWKYFENFTDVPENVVRIGRAWNREPIYLGSGEHPDIISILMTSKKILLNGNKYSKKKYALVCENDTKWIEATPPKVPANAVAIKENEFVARLEGPVSFIPAYISNYLHYCSTSYNDIQIHSKNCEVLVGKKQYEWQFAGLFERIPENAVVIGRTEDDEFIYVIRDTLKSLSSVTFSQLVTAKGSYEFLVRKEV